VSKLRATALHGVTSGSVTTANSGTDAIRHKPVAPVEIPRDEICLMVVAQQCRAENALPLLGRGNLGVYPNAVRVVRLLALALVNRLARERLFQLFRELQVPFGFRVQHDFPARVFAINRARSRAVHGNRFSKIFDESVDLK
jgi:hypothetical protein